MASLARFCAWEVGAYPEKPVPDGISGAPLELLFQSTSARWFVRAWPVCTFNLVLEFINYEHATGEPGTGPVAQVARAHP